MQNACIVNHLGIKIQFLLFVYNFLKETRMSADCIMAEQDEPIIFKITTSQRDLVKKFAALINNVLEQQFGAIFLEPIEDGYLYICKNEAIFKSLNQILTPAMRNFAKNYVASENKQINVNDILEEKKFPRNGFSFQYIAQNEQSIRLIPFFIDYYRSMVPEIKVFNQTENSFELLFETFEAFRFQINLIYGATQFVTK